MDTRIVKHSTEEELDLQFSQLRQEKNHFQGFSVEALRLLVQMKRNKCLSKYKSHFNCWVVELEQKNDGSFDIDKFLNLLLQIPTSDTPSRLQFIIKNGGHYTTMDVLLSSNGNQCIILDAIGDLRGKMLAFQAFDLKDQHHKKFFDCTYLICPENKADILQTDSFSCPVFAYDHAYQAAKIENLYEYLAGQNQDNEKFIAVSWMKMPAKLVWNSQSAGFIKMYVKEHQEASHLFQLNTRFNQAIDENNKPKLATELLFGKYRKRYMDLKTKSDHQPILAELATPTNIAFNDLSLHEKLILIVHAHQYWLNNSKKNDLPKRIQKMQDASSMQEFIREAKSSSFTPTLFKAKVTQRFYKAIQMQDVQIIDDYYQQIKQKPFN